ncbi:MAG TPA: WYL domain-containing protein [Mycobacteriales bacterium]|nr:WYL domain-containing protein [Mycobacteriales bacterium]
MSGTAERLQRLLALLPYLLARPGVPVTEVAADFGVSEQQLRRDLELLWMCGLPGHGPGDLIDLSFEGETISVGYDAGISRPLRLTSDEALALVVALRTLSEVPGLAGRDAVGRALAKVEYAAGDAAGAAGAVAVRMEARERTLSVVQQALDTGRAMHLRYYTSGRDETTDRDVDPMRLLLVDGRSYLEAWCRRVEGTRLFRLDRIDEVRILDEPARPPAEATPRDLSGGLYQPAPEHPEVTLRLSPTARWVADYYPCEKVRELSRGRIEATLRVADTDWVRRLVLRLGGNAEVVAPPALVEQVRDEAQAALAAYGEVGSAP